MKRTGIKRIIYDSNIPGVIYLGKPKTALGRMARAERLMYESAGEDILKELRSAITKKPPKQIDEDLDLNKIEFPQTSSRGLGGFGDANLLGNISSAFNNAAAARRSFVKSGGNIKDLERNFFIKRTLASQFGGDAIRVLKGSFSSSPEAQNDPIKSESERMSSMMNRDIQNSRKIADAIKSLEAPVESIKKAQESVNNLSGQSEKQLKSSVSVFANIRKNIGKYVNSRKTAVNERTEISEFRQKFYQKSRRDKTEALAEVMQDVSEPVTIVTEGLKSFSETAKDLKKKSKEDEKFCCCCPTAPPIFGGPPGTIPTPGGPSGGPPGGGGGGIPWFEIIFGAWDILDLIDDIRRGPGKKFRLPNVRKPNIKLPQLPKGMPKGTGGAGGILSKLRGIKIPPGLARAGGMLRGLGSKVLAPLLILDLVDQSKKIFNPNDNIITALQDFGQANVNMFKSLTGGGDPFESGLYPQRGDYSQMEEGSQEWIAYKSNMSQNRRILARRQAADPERYNKEKDSILQKHPYVKDFYDNPDPQNRLNLRPPDVSQYGDIPEGHELKKQDDGTWKMVKKEEKMSGGGVIAGEAGSEIKIDFGTSEGNDLLNSAKEGGKDKFLTMAPLLTTISGMSKDPVYGPLITPVIDGDIQKLMSDLNINSLQSGGITFGTAAMTTAASKTNNLVASSDKGDEETGFFGKIMKNISNMLGGAWNAIKKFFGFGGSDNRITSPGLPANTDPARGQVMNLGLSQKEAYKKIYDLAVKVGGAKHPHLVASIAMLETGWLTQVGGNNPFNQRDTSGNFINYDSMEDSVKDHIKFWHKTDKYPDNANAYDDPNEAWANLVNKYAPAQDNNNPESYKQSVANMMTTMQGEMSTTATPPSLSDSAGPTSAYQGPVIPSPVSSPTPTGMSTQLEQVMNGGQSASPFVFTMPPPPQPPQTRSSGGTMLESSNDFWAQMQNAVLAQQ